MSSVEKTEAHFFTKKTGGGVWLLAILQPRYWDAEAAREEKKFKLNHATVVSIDSILTFFIPFSYI